MTILSKKLFLLSFFILFVHTSFSQEKLTNQSIMDLMDLGFSEDVIISKINSSDIEFKTDIESLKALKSKGVSPKVLSLLITKSSSQTQTETGIYYINNDEKIKIEPNVFSGTKTNVLASALSYGIANSNTKSYINNANSSNIVNNQRPEFIFYFDKDKSEDKLSQTNWWFQTASSPQEFALVKMKSDVKRQRRAIITGKFGLANGGASTGVDSKSSIPFDLKKQTDGSYKINPTRPLLPGEYCFFYKGSSQVFGYSNQSVFDFSVR